MKQSDLPNCSKKFGQNFCVLPFFAFATYLKLFDPKIILFQN